MAVRWHYWSLTVTSGNPFDPAHNPKVVGSNPTPPRGSQEAVSDRRRSTSKRAAAPEANATTADVYTHTSEEADQEAALAVEGAICGELVPNLFPTGNKTGNEAVNVNSEVTFAVSAT